MQQIIERDASYEYVLAEVEGLMSWCRAVVGSLMLVVALTGCTSSTVTTAKTTTVRSLVRSTSPSLSASSKLSSAASTPSGRRSESGSSGLQPPLRGPQIEDAHLFSRGHGYAVAAGHLLWTTDDGATWHNITPPHAVPVTPGSLAVRPDGDAWVAVTTSSTGPVTVFHRGSSAAGWQSTRVAVSALNPDRYGKLHAAVSFD